MVSSYAKKDGIPIQTVIKTYSLTPSTVQMVDAYARKNECTQSMAIRALIRIATEYLEGK